MQRALAVLVTSLVLSAGCGGGKLSPGETAPFAAAIEQYLAAKSMGMKVDTFKSLDVTGDNATAEVYVADKDVGYGIRPLWKFTFQRLNGAWKVSKSQNLVE